MPGKKLVFSFAILLPFAFSLFIESLLEKFGYHWEIPTLNAVRYVLLVVVILSSIFLVYINHAVGNKKTGWDVAGIFFLILSAMLLYGFYSLSNFGF